MFHDSQLLLLPRNISLLFFLTAPHFNFVAQIEASMDHPCLICLKLRKEEEDGGVEIKAAHPTLSR